MADLFLDHTDHFLGSRPFAGCALYRQARRSRFTDPKRIKG